MKIVLIIFLFFSVQLSASTYYVDAVNGNDAAGGLSPATAWRSLARVNSFVFSSGDIVLFKRGQVFYGGLRPSASGLAYNSYGTGDKPVITGFTSLSAWTNIGGGVYEAPCNACGETVRAVSIQDTLVPMGRYPNTGTANGGYLTYESFDNADGSTDRITDNQLSGSPSWTGGDAVVKRTNWSLDRGKIVSHSGNTLTFNSTNPYPLNNGFGYFITNHPATLDQLGEWYYDPATKKLRVYFGGTTPFAVNAATVDTLLVVNRDNIQVDNIAFTGANIIGVYAKNISNGYVKNSTIKNIGQDGFVLDGPVSFYTIESDSILNIQNGGIRCYFNATLSSAIRNNYLGNIGAVPGMGIDYSGISGNGQSLTIEGNTLKKIGYNGIIAGGTNTTVSKNFIDTYNMLLDDGGGIYTGGNTVGNILIEDNIILNGVGAPKGIVDTTVNFSTSGIFLDDNSHFVTVRRNTIYNATLAAIRVHNSSNNIITNNTTFSNGRGIDLSYDNIAYPPMNNNTIQQNILFGIYENQVSLYAFTRLDISTLFNLGAIDNNYYVNPFYPGGVVLSEYGGGTRSLFGVANWPAKFGYDVHSGAGPVRFSPFTISSVIGPNIAGTNSLSGVKSEVFKYLNFGTVTGGNKYQVKFQLYSSGPETESVGMRFLQNGGNYHGIGNKQYFPVTTTSTPQTLLYQPDASETDMLGIDLFTVSNTLHLDNIDVRQVNAIPANPSDSVQFAYNETASIKNIPLNGTYKDALNNTYTSGISLPPYTSAVLMKVGSTTVYPPPTANAGGNATLTLPANSIRLYGTGTAAPGLSIVSYSWVQLPGGPPYTIVSPTEASTVVNNLAVGAHTFRLTVTDNNGGTGTADVTIYINAGTGTTYPPPTANAGGNATLALPANSVRLYGTGTAAAGLAIAGYSWVQLPGGPSYTIVSPTEASTVVSNLAVGAHTFRLTVSDNNGGTGSSDVTIYIVSGARSATAIEQQPGAANITATITAYPIPATNRLNIKWTSAYRGNAVIDVYDLTGRKLYTLPVRKDQADYLHSIPVGKLVKGAYYLDIRHWDGKQAGHVIFEK